MLTDLARSFGQLTDPQSRGTIWRALGLTVLTFVFLWVLAYYGLASVGEWLIRWAGTEGVDGFWVTGLEWLYGAAVVSGVLLASWLLFPAVAGLTLSLFLEPVCRAVERRYYPAHGEARPQSIGEIVADTARITLLTVGLNLLALPVYLTLLFFPPLHLVLFYGLNGSLLGREYFEMVAVRRVDSLQARALRRSNGMRVFLGGLLLAILLTLPIINLVMPIVATAFMLHQFERLRGARR